MENAKINKAEYYGKENHNARIHHMCIDGRMKMGKEIRYTIMENYLFYFLQKNNTKKL